jgi:DNA-binding GntR family transcriptional regulator
MSAIAVQKVRRLETIAQQVLDHIRGAIFSGRLAAGTRIDQHAIAAELGVSIIPVRESLRQLEAEGLIEKRPYRGAFVVELSMTELMDIYITREALEELATRLAVERMTPATLKSLGGLIEEMSQATKAGDREALFDLNASFHFTLYSASRNAILCQLIESLWDRSTVYRRRFTFMPGRAEQALSEHRAILAACRRGDAATAGAAVRANVAQTTKAISEESRRSPADPQE